MQHPIELSFHDAALYKLYCDTMKGSSVQSTIGGELLSTLFRGIGYCV